MRLLLIALLFTLSAVAEKETVTPRKVTLDDYKGTVPNSDDILYENLRRVKNQEVDAYLVDNPATKECKTLHIKKDEDFKDATIRGSVRECFREKLDQLQDTQIEKISDDLNLVGYGVIKDNSVPAIKDYFDERLEKALYGEVQGGKKTGSMKDITKQKFVDHSTFLSLYDTQLGKNTLLKISEFCLTFDYEGPITKENDDETITKIASAKNTECKLDSESEKIVKCFKKQVNDKLKRESIVETFKKTNQNASSGGVSGKEILENKWRNCASSIKLLCDHYTYKTKGVGEYNVEKIEQQFPTADYSDDDKELLRRSCQLVKHMKDHRDVIVKINEQKEELKKLKSKGGVSLGTTFKGAYGSQKGNEKSLDELTTIASDVIAGQYDDTQDKSDAEACAQNGAESDECQKFFKTVEEQDQEKLILDYELKAMAQVKQYNDSIKDLDQAKLKEQLEKDGDEKLLKELENKTPEEIKEIMYQRYKAERMAIVNDLWKRVQEKEVVQEDENAADKVSKIKEEIDTKKERIRGLYHYSNIVTSYLTFEGSDKTNTVGFAAEQENFEEDENEANQYFQDLQPTDMSASNSNDNQATSVNLGFIDSFLHKKIKKNENETNN